MGSSAQSPLVSLAPTILIRRRAPGSVEVPLGHTPCGAGLSLIITSENGSADIKFKSSNNVRGIATRISYLITGKTAHGASICPVSGEVEVSSDENESTGIDVPSDVQFYEVTLKQIIVEVTDPLEGQVHVE